MTDTRPDTPRSRGDHDAPHVTAVTPSEDARTIMINNISWGGVLAGVVAALVAQLLLNMLGIGVGASTLDPGTGDNPTATSFSTVAAIWWAVSGIVAAFIGGYVASRLSGRPKASTGGWHGLTSWAVTTLVVVFLLSSAVGGLIGGAFQHLERRTRGTWTRGRIGGGDSRPGARRCPRPFCRDRARPAWRYR